MITIIIIIATVAISILALQNFKIQEACIFSPTAISYNNQWYRFITCGFIHADEMHLAFNMISLYMFGNMVEDFFNLDLSEEALDFSRLSLYFLKNKIEIYEYQKNILHGKVAVCDERLVTIGSYNINNLSAYVSLELNVDINNIQFSREIESTIDGIITNECIPITEEKFNQITPFLKYALYWTSYQILRVVFNLCTFYFKQKRH